MKKILSILLTLLTILTLVACANNTESNNTKDTAKEEVKVEKANVRLGGLKGPTSMGMVKMLDDNEKGETENEYEFTMAGSADELTPKLLKGELDILAVPANLGSVLYNKSEGAVKFLAVNMLGAIYICEKNGETVQALSDLKGKTVYATGKGSTPEYVLAYLLNQNGIDIEKDLTIEWKNEPSETVAAMATQDNAIAMLPQPFVAVAKSKIPTLRVAVDLNEVWEKLGVNSKFVTAGIVVNADFAENNPDAVKAFLRDYEKSTTFVKENIDEAASLIEKYDIVNADIAKEALPQCNIVCMTGDEMKKSVTGYFEVLFNQNPASVGGEMPSDDFFLVY
ncbi:MAG: ABC transporter substrate-binding protein [Clostridia bacterium]|nr:ABC transporter substrate-binding protein [Clostridia bacterium]